MNMYSMCIYKLYFVDESNEDTVRVQSELV